MAQLVAHLHGMQGVRGSSPLSSTGKSAGTIRFRRTFLFSTTWVLAPGFGRLHLCPDSTPARLGGDLSGNGAWKGPAGSGLRPIGVLRKSALLWSGCSGEFDRKKQSTGLWRSW